MKELLIKLFTGWCNRENSFDYQKVDGDGPMGSAYMIGEEEAFLKIDGVTEHEATLLALFGHWSNDIQSIAAHYGVGLQFYNPVTGVVVADPTEIPWEERAKYRMRVRTDIPPAPSPKHWWDDNAWHAPESPDPNEGPAQE